MLLERNKNKRRTRVESERIYTDHYHELTNKLLTNTRKTETQMTVLYACINLTYTRVHSCLSYSPLFIHVTTIAVNDRERMRESNNNQQ